jgi:hypothetical protein
MPDACSLSKHGYSVSGRALDKAAGENYPFALRDAEWPS